MISVDQVLALSIVMFIIGTIGALTRRNLLLVLMSLQLMLGAAGLAFVGFSRVWASGAAAGALGGQIFVLVAIVVAAGQLALGLALVAAVVRKRSSLDIEDLGRLKW